MKDFSEVQEFLDSINTFPIFTEFKRIFLPMYVEQLKDKTMWVDYSSLIRGISYDVETSTLFVVFVSLKTYAYYDVPVDIFLCGAFTDYLNEMEKAGDLPKDMNTDNLSMGGWFNETVKGYFNYTLLN